MTLENEELVMELVGATLGQAKRHSLAATLAPMIPETSAVQGPVTRAHFAAALNVVLFADLLGRVPSGAAYVKDLRMRGEMVCFDHGAIRTVAFPTGDTGSLPRGELAFRRIFEPLGYEEAAIYPLPALSMTGRAYRHRDFPETIPQFFVSELHVGQFDTEFEAAASRVFGTSHDPLDADANDLLDRFSAGGGVSHDDAVRVLPKIVAAFGRQHDQPSLDDYLILKASSNEAAWIATEGNAFNHATDRVDNVVEVAKDQKALGRPMKDEVEFSRTGRVRQTAFRADMVERGFVTASGGERRMMVPGSFYEFISRDIDPATGTLDLSFDSGNANGIFHMTKAA